MEEKTAVEWLVLEIAMKNNDINFDFWGAVEQSKEMEKQQIISAFLSGQETINYDEKIGLYREIDENEYIKNIIFNK